MSIIRIAIALAVANVLAMVIGLAAGNPTIAGVALIVAVVITMPVGVEAFEEYERSVK